MNDRSSAEEHDEAPSFTPMVEGGVSPLQYFPPPFPQNYFILIDLQEIQDRNIHGTMGFDYCHYMVQDLIRSCLRIFKSGNFQMWQNQDGLCIRLSCSEFQLEKFLAVTKNTARVWGASESCITKYRSDYPKAA